MEMRISIRMTHFIPFPAVRSTTFAESLDATGAGDSSIEARSAVSAGLMFGGGTFLILFFLLAMVGLSDGQSVFQSQPTSFFARDTLKRLSGRPQETARSIGRSPMVYHNEQTVAVVALGPRKTLLDCELIEAYNPEEKVDILKNLSGLRPLPVTFEQMMELIGKCQELSWKERQFNSASRGPRTLANSNVDSMEQLRAINLDAVGALTLFQGIMPGTKWCGTGDLASTYYDLGADIELDLCCRSHDLCPVKVRAFTSRFNLTNYSIYSKSHCECDEMFYNCLKRISHSNAFMIGNFYFNLLRVPCIDKQVHEKQSTPASIDMQFIRNKLTF